MSKFAVRGLVQSLGMSGPALGSYLRLTVGSVWFGSSRAPRVRYLRERIRSWDDPDRPRYVWPGLRVSVCVRSFDDFCSYRSGESRRRQDRSRGKLTNSCLSFLGRRLTVILQMVGLPASTPRGKPEDIASLVSYLAKPESRFLTG